VPAKPLNRPVMGKPRILALLGGAVLLGQERGNLEALAALKDKGCDIYCLIRDEDWSLEMAPALDALGIPWCKVRYLYNYRGGSLVKYLYESAMFVIRGSWQFLREYRSFRPTYIHACNPMFVLSFAPGLLLVRTPLVFRAGDEPTLHNVFWRLLWAFVVRRTRFFVAVSHFTAMSLIRNGVPENRVEIIYSAPPRRPEASPPPGAVSAPDAELVLAFIGQITPAKGFDVLIEAIRKLRQARASVRLKIAGRIYSEWPGHQWARDLSDAVLADNCLREHVEFLGFVEDINALLAQCHVLVVPSVSEEPLGNVVIEAKLCSRPSIVFPRGGLPELVQSGKDGIVCQDTTASSLVTAIKVYLDAPQLIPPHGEAARESLGALGINQFASRWLKVYSVSGERRLMW
jgi:glycosyltransferase involved in cell wall biosynthesis